MNTPILTPEETVSAQLREMSADLLVLDRALKLKPRGVNGRRLAEFRQMIDIVRHTAFRVQTWLEALKRNGGH